MFEFEEPESCEGCKDVEMTDSEKYFRRWLNNSKVAYSFLCQKDGHKDECPNLPIEKFDAARDFKRPDFMVSLGRRRKRLAIEIKQKLKLPFDIRRSELEGLLNYSKEFRTTPFIVCFLIRDFTTSYWIPLNHILWDNRHPAITFKEFESKADGAFKFGPDQMHHVDLKATLLKKAWPQIDDFERQFRPR
jgi:hypothetical protein